jgi:NYN domain
MTLDHVALLIDADNVSMDVIEQAIIWTAKHYGGPHIRRAYCTPESAVKHQERFKRLAIRPMVNLAAGKNSTDIALAVDAIEIAVTERPNVFVIASSDSDFAPVVSRLRERGCRVVGLGQQGKVGQETRGIYDDYEIFAHHGDDSAAPASTSRGRGRGTPRKTVVASKVPVAPAKPARAVKKTAVKKAAAPSVGAEAVAAVTLVPTARKTSARKTPTARKTAARKVASAPTTAPATSPIAPPPARAAAPPSPAMQPSRPPSASASSDTGGTRADALLQALPELQSGGWMQLNLAGQRLREARLLGKSGSSIRLLKQFPQHFILEPEDRPNRVRAA